MEQGWRSGARCRVTIPKTPECWRCAEPGRGKVNLGRVLRPYALVADGKVIGTVHLCGPCVETRTPLNPDPLDVQAA
jgi:hypothetical protein